MIRNKTTATTAMQLTYPKWKFLSLRGHLLSRVEIIKACAKPFYVVWNFVLISKCRICGIDIGRSCYGGTISPKFLYCNPKFQKRKTLRKKQGCVSRLFHLPKSRRQLLFSKKTALDRFSLYSILGLFGNSGFGQITKRVFLISAFFQ